LSRIGRSLRGLWEALRGRGEATIVPAWEVATGAVPEVSFETMMRIYLSDPAARAAVDFLADQVVGAGFYTTVNEGYERAEEAKTLMDDFNERVNMDGLLQQTAREIIAFGNSFWEKVTAEHLEELRILPLTSIERIHRTAQGRVTGYRQRPSYGGGLLRPEQVIHFRWNPVNSEAEGCGLLRTLAEGLATGDGVREPFYRMKAKMQQAMIEQFQKFSAPNELWVFPGLSKEEAQAYARQVRGVPRRGARFVTNVEGAEVKQIIAERSRAFDSYVENILNDYLLGLETPLPRLFTTPGFTEASARAALEIAERKVLSLQRFLKRIVEREVFALVIRQAGMRPEKAKCRLHWGAPKPPEVEIQDLLRAFEVGAIRLEEVRKNLSARGWELWEAGRGV